MSEAVVRPALRVPVQPVSGVAMSDSDAALQKTEPVATSDESPAPQLSALERLEASRARIRGALLQIGHPRPPDTVGASSGDLKSKLLRMARDVPGVSVIADSVESWWAQHPLHTAGIVAMEASREVVGPLARRNPFVLVVGATVVGALFVASRPWRWLIRPALFIGLVPQLASHLIRRVPLDNWMRMGMRFLMKPQRGAQRTPRSTEGRRTSAEAAI